MSYAPLDPRCGLTFPEIKLQCLHRLLLSPQVPGCRSCNSELRPREAEIDIRERGELFREIAPIGAIGSESRACLHGRRGAG